MALHEIIGRTEPLWRLIENLDHTKIDLKRKLERVIRLPKGFRYFVCFKKVSIVESENTTSSNLRLQNQRLNENILRVREAERCLVAPLKDGVVLTLEMEVVT